jgi:hypothetical protein
LCSPRYLDDVLDVLLLDLEGSAAQHSLPEGWSRFLFRGVPWGSSGGKPSSRGSPPQPSKG